MQKHTSLVQVWLAPLNTETSAHPAEGMSTVVVHGPHVSGLTAIVQRRDLRADVGHTGSLRPKPTKTQVDVHVSAGPDEVDPQLMSVADVIVRRAGSGGPGPRSLSEIRTRFPGCLVAAVIDYDKSCVWAGHPGQQIQFVSLPETRPSEPRPKRKGTRAYADFLCCASVIHAWLVAGRRLADLDTAHLIVSCDPATPGHRVRVILAHRDLDRANEETARPIGC